MHLYPTASERPVTHSGELCLRTPSLAYLIGAVDGPNPQSGRCTLGSAPLALHPRTVKIQVSCLNFGKPMLFTHFTDYKRMSVLAVVEVSPMRYEQLHCQ